MEPTDPRKAATAQVTRLVLPLQLGDVWIAIDPSYVIELLGSRTWMRVPGASPNLPGVLSWRSRAIAVLDLPELLGITARTTSSPARTVVARVDDCTFAFFVETAREARTVDESALASPHAVTGRFIRHQLTLDGRVMPIVDLAAVIEGVSRAPVERT